MDAQQAVALLLSKVRKPYIWGANGPNKFDCSGLVYWWYNATGNKRSDTTAQGLYNRTKPIPGNPKLGDLVFLHSSGFISHVGIMINSGWLIEARGRAWGVRKTRLSTFRKRGGYTYAGIRRDPKFKLVAHEGTPVFTVGTCNARYAGLDTGKFIWKLRRARLGNLLTHTGANVYAFQELTEAMQKQLAEYMPGYEWFHARSRGRSIAWKGVTATDKRNVLIAGHTVPVVTFDNGVTVVSIHNDAYNPALRKLQTAQLAKAFSTQTKCILAGDYSTAAPSVNGFQNAKNVVDADNENWNSYHPFKRKPKKDAHWTDHLLYRGLTCDALAQIVTDTATDHNIITGTFH